MEPNVIRVLRDYALSRWTRCCDSKGLQIVVLSRIA